MNMQKAISTVRTQTTFAGYGVEYEAVAGGVGEYLVFAYCPASNRLAAVLVFPCGAWEDADDPMYALTRYAPLHWREYVESRHPEDWF